MVDDGDAEDKVKGSGSVGKGQDICTGEIGMWMQAVGNGDQRPRSVASEIKEIWADGRVCDSNVLAVSAANVCSKATCQ